VKFLGMIDRSLLDSYGYSISGVSALKDKINRYRSHSVWFALTNDLHIGLCDKNY